MNQQYFLFLFFSVFSVALMAQNGSLSGNLLDAEGAPVPFAYVSLFKTTDSTLVKVEGTDDNGAFLFQEIPAGPYWLSASFVGLGDLTRSDVMVKPTGVTKLGTIQFDPAAVNLTEVSVTATRVMVEVKPDRTVFNVEGTINSTGGDGISLLRKAPGVLLDNNNGITVLGRSGVLVYVDGKRLPLGGADLTAYLESLPAEQIDRFEIITNPGAKYEAEGNAGIIDIRLKKNKNYGGNGSVGLTASQGRKTRGNVNVSGNYRTKRFNTFASANARKGERWTRLLFESQLNGVFLNERNVFENEYDDVTLRLGTDYTINDKNTIGVLVSGGINQNTGFTDSRTALSALSTPSMVDSILVANSISETDRNNRTFNINYRFDNKQGRTIDVDVDYGDYNNDNFRNLPNQYFSADESVLLQQINNQFDTPTDIDIYTFNVDYEEEIFGGKLGLGSKLSRVNSDNSFLFFDETNGDPILNRQQSNDFDYEENVYAGYANFARPLSEKISMSAGLRLEQTDATGDLTAYDPALEEEPVDLNYLSWFPSIGMTYSPSRQHTWSANYGRRINRPDYNVLNPFRNQINQLSFELGNPRLNPEIVNNFEVGYTYAYRYNFKVAYSRTIDQITRLLGPDSSDPRATFISWDNLATQSIISFNASLPFQITEWWSSFVNLSANHLSNQADYGERGVVDLQAFSYNIFQQSTFELGKGWKGEVSGWYSGPGIWGGVFEYDPTFSVDLGIQRKFLEDRLNVRLSVSDIFFQTPWSGTSRFNGLTNTGTGAWDSRRVAVNLNYSFGNENIKARKRKTGLEEEAKRLGN